MRYIKEGIGELIGTFFLVLFGCGSVAVAFCFDEYHGIFQTGIVRGSAESFASAKMFGEYYAFSGITMGQAMLAEAFGTFILVFMIFALTEGANVGRPDSAIAPLFIGLTVTTCLVLIAPLTQAGLNPARDFAPRLVALIFGWGGAAFPDSSGGAFWVYIFAPVVGGILAGVLYTHVLERFMAAKTEQQSEEEQNENENHHTGRFFGGRKDHYAWESGQASVGAGAQGGPHHQ